MYHGDIIQYPIRNISDIRSDDRVLTYDGHVIHSSSVVTMYENFFSRALEAKKFRLKGRFDCSNAYIKPGMTSAEFSSLPKLRADSWYPFYLQHTSELINNVNSTRCFPHTVMEARQVESLALM